MTVVTHISKNGHYKLGDKKRKFFLRTFPANTSWFKKKKAKKKNYIYKSGYVVTV